jgi:hypothetical protein
MRCGIPVQGDHPWGSMLLRRPGKEPLGGGHITPFAQEEIDGAPLFIDGAVQVNPLAAHLEIRLIHSPRIAHRPRIMVPAFLKVRHVPLHPTQDGRVGQQDAALGPSFGPGHGNSSLKARYHRRQSTMISWSKCRLCRRNRLERMKSQLLRQQTRVAHSGMGSLSTVFVRLTHG